MLEVPTARRVPDPPKPFVGRKTEIAQLQRWLRTDRLAVVHAPGGQGKSALVAHTLHRKFAARVPFTQRISFLGADPHNPFLEVARSLVETTPGLQVHWREMLGDETALLALAAELVERQGRWVVLEDLHLAEPEAAVRLLGGLSRLVGDARWVVTTRTAPEGVPALALPPMREAELGRLARAWIAATEKERVRKAVDASGGSPGALRTELLGALDESSAWVGLLSAVRVPVPPAAFGRLAPALSAGALEELRVRGLLEENELGVRLNERAIREGREVDASVARDAAALLVEIGDPASVAEAVRLEILSGRHAEAAAVLDAHGTSLLDAGFAPRLWKSLSQADGSLARWRLRVALELGDDPVLADLERPTDDDPEAGLLWARALWLQGKLEESEVAARQSAQAAGDDPDLAFRAGLLEAQCVANQGKLAETLTLLAALSPFDDESYARLETLQAMVESLLGDVDAAEQTAQRLRARLPRVPWPRRATAAMGLARTLYNLGHPRRASEVIDSALAAGPGTTAAFENGRQMLYNQACFALEAGHLASARESLERLDPYLGHRSLLRPHLVTAQVFHALASGEFETVDARLALVREEARQRSNEDLQDEAEHLRTQVALLRAEGDAPAPADVPARSSVFSTMLWVAQLERGLRAGTVEATSVLEALAELPGPGEAVTEYRLVRATAHLLDGHEASALAELGDVLADVRARGFGVREAQALQRQGEVLLVLGDRAAALESAEALAVLSETFPSARYADVAAFLRMAATEEALDAAVLEGLASGVHRAPDIARRAQHLLGGGAPLDALDRRVLDAVGAQWRSPRGEVGGSWTPGWGLDAGRHRVWLPTGAWVDFGPRSLGFKLLAQLCAAGGEATKEALTLGVWGEREYHPLRHDNRLHAAVSKLRRRIEVDAKDPQRLVTTDDGYALRSRFRSL